MPPAARRARALTARFVPLPEQDRTLWDPRLITRGQELVRASLRRNIPGRYQLQAAINAVHSDAVSAADTDWSQILALYDQLLALEPSPVVALNRAVAVAEVRGAEAGLTALDGLPLEAYYLLHAVRADFLHRLGRCTEAVAEYDVARALTANEAEQALWRVPGMLRPGRPVDDRVGAPPGGPSHSRPSAPSGHA